MLGAIFKTAAPEKCSQNLTNGTFATNVQSHVEVHMYVTFTNKE